MTPAALAVQTNPWPGPRTWRARKGSQRPTLIRPRMASRAEVCRGMPGAIAWVRWRRTGSASPSSPAGSNPSGPAGRSSLASRALVAFPRICPGCPEPERSTTKPLDGINTADSYHPDVQRGWRGQAGTWGVGDADEREPARAAAVAAGDGRGAPVPGAGRGGGRPGVRARPPRPDPG